MSGLFDFFDFGDSSLPASIRYNNPGAMWPGPSALAYGSIGSNRIGGGNLIAQFPDPISGAAAQFDLLNRNYVGMPLGAAINKWSGGNSSPQYTASVAKTTGLSPNTVLSPELLSNPDTAIPLAKAMARQEAGRDYPLTDEQWQAAHSMALDQPTGSPAGLPVQAADLPIQGTSNGKTSMENDTSLTPPPGLLERFGNMASNPLLQFGLALASGRTPQEGLGNAFQATTAINQQRQVQASQQAAYQALVNAGVPPQAAVAAALNPQMLGAFKPTLTETGQDPLTGQKTFAWTSPFSQSMTPAANPNNNQAASTAISNPDNLTGEDYLKTLPTGTSNTVRAILEGRMQPPTSFAASKPYWQALLQHAANAEPGFDLTKWQGRVGAAKDFSSGQAAKNVTSLNTVIGHLDTLREAADKLDNTSIPVVNWAKNYLYNEMGRPEVKNFEVARNAVADEMAKVFRSTGMSDTEIKSWKDTLGTTNSPDQLKAVVGQGVDLMNSRLDALKDQYRRGYGKEPPELLSPKAQKTLENVRNWTLGSAPSQATPSAPSRSDIETEMRRRGLLK